MDITVYQAKVNAVARCIVANYEIYADGNNPDYHNLSKAIETAGENSSDDVDTYEFQEGVKLAKSILNIK